MPKGRAALAMSHGMSVWVLEVRDGFGDAGYHAHHAIQITASLTGSLRLIGQQASLSAPVLAVKSEAVHRIEADGTIAFVFVEPESRAGRALTEELFSGGEIAESTPEIRELLAPLATVLDGTPDRTVMLEAGRRAISRLDPGHDPKPSDPRIRRLIDQAAQRLDGPLSLRQAAEGIYVSESRLRHLFVEETGIPFKTYVLWLRLVRALDLYSQGSSLTEAAHSAGFSDSAHLSRIFRRNFGLPATTLARI
jgi:AraC-like DNA-binding protein